MREVETDYLVIGADGSGMAFADTLVAHTDAEFVLVDRRHRPGGHFVFGYLAEADDPICRRAAARIRRAARNAVSPVREASCRARRVRVTLLDE